MIFRQLFDTESSAYTYLIGDAATGAAEPVLPWFLLLSAIIGGALPFAGLSGNRMMALLLAKLPFNQPRRPG